MVVNYILSLLCKEVNHNALNCVRHWNFESVIFHTKRLRVSASWKCAILHRAADVLKGLAVSAFSDKFSLIQTNFHSSGMLSRSDR